VTFGSVVAVDGLCLTVPANTVLGLMGPNGSGKSTVIDAVTGFVGHERGRIEVGGSPIDHLGATRRARAGVRRTFQQGRAVPTLTVGQYLRLAASGRLPGANLARLIDHFDLPAPDRPVRLVDAGTRRILELAAALAGGPTVVFADEPAAGLGPEARAGLADAIRAIPERFGCSVVCVEHDLDLLVACCDEILVLDLGRALVQATPPAVMADPLVRAAMLGARTRPGEGGGSAG
jgi:branched-chain amino acid transport system permease protein